MQRPIVIINRNGCIESYIKFYAIRIFNNVSISVYSVVDTTNKSSDKVDSFLEIEIKEEIISKLTEAEALGIINFYEEYLRDFGIHSKTRLKKSLFELYSKGLNK